MITNADIERIATHAAALSPQQIADTCSPRHIQSVLEDLQRHVRHLVAHIQGAPSLQLAEAPTNKADRAKHGCAASVIDAEEDYSVTILRNPQDLADMLSGGAHGRHRDEMAPALRIVGVVVRRHEVQATLAHLRQRHTAIARHDHSHTDAAAVNDGVKGHELGPLSDGDQGADDLQSLPPSVVRPHSVLHVPEVSDWSPWLGDHVVFIVDGADPSATQEAR